MRGVFTGVGRLAEARIKCEDISLVDLTAEAERSIEVVPKPWPMGEDGGERWCRENGREEKLEAGRLAPEDVYA